MFKEMIAMLSIARHRDPAQDAIEAAERKTSEMEQHLSRMDGSIDPLKAMIKSMRNSRWTTDE